MTIVRRSGERLRSVCHMLFPVFTKSQKTRENELKNIKKKIKEEYGIEITDEYFT